MAATEVPLATLQYNCLKLAGRALQAVCAELGVALTADAVQAAGATLFIQATRNPRRPLFPPKALQPGPPVAEPAAANAATEDDDEPPFEVLPADD